MIVDERMVTYIRSLERPENPVMGSRVPAGTGGFAIVSVYDVWI